jgi:hypothetical protein
MAQILDWNKPIKTAMEQKHAESQTPISTQKRRFITA